MGVDLTSSAAGRVVVTIGAEFARTGPDRFTINPASVSDYHRLLETLRAEDRPVTDVIHLWTYQTDRPERITSAALEDAQVKGLYSLTYLVQALAQNQGPDYPVRILIASTNTQPVSEQESVAFENAPLVGLIKTVSQEMPYLDCRHVDLEGKSLAEDAVHIARELSSHGDREVAYRNGQRLISRLEHVHLPGQPRLSTGLKSGGMYLLTGGLGGIALELARYLILKYNAHLLLVGRTPLPDRTNWSLDHPASVRERIDTLQGLEALGGKVRYAVADVCEAEQLRTAVLSAEEEWNKRLDGVFHLAGLYRDQLLVEETAKTLETAICPKVAGALALHQLLEDRPECLFVAFSSTTSYFGGAMFGAYAAANRFLDTFCHWRRYQAGLPTYSFGWSTWNEIGMNRSTPGKDPLRATGRGFRELSAEQGLNSLLAGLAYDQPQLLIGLDGSNANIRRHLENASPMAQKLAVGIVVSGDKVRSAHLETTIVHDRFGTPSFCDLFPLEEMPRTASGEIDRQTLSELARTALRGGAERVAPRTEMERRVAHVCQEVLGIPQIGIHDNFFELGGHSLLATLVMSRLAESLYLELPLRLLFEAPTIAGLAEKIVRQQAEDIKAQPIVPISRDQELPLSFAQQRIWFVEQLEPGTPAHNLLAAMHLQGELNVRVLAASLSEIIRRHETLRTTFPEVDGKPVIRVAPLHQSTCRLSTCNISTNRTAKTKHIV